jgi:O-antigen/teichoic acid export membrane protein
MAIFNFRAKLPVKAISYFSKSGFLSAVAKLSGATVLGQFVTLLASVILTRLYTPEEFGFLAVFLALLTQMTVFTSLRYEWAIPPAKDDDDAFHLVVWCFLIVFGTTILATVSVATAGKQIAQWLNFPKIASYLYLFPIALLFIGWYQVFNYWALRKKEFSLLATSQVNKSIWTSGSQVLLGMCLAGPIGLLIGAVVNQIAGTHILAKYFLRDYRSGQFHLSPSKLVAIALKYRQFAGICIISSFFNYAAIAAPPVLLSFFYNPDAVGAFSLAQRLSALPAVFISNAISQVYFANACRLVHEDPQELKRLHVRTTMLLLGVSSLAGGAFLVSPWVIPWVFGTQWQTTGVMAQYMSPMLVVTLAISPLTMLEWMERNLEILVWHMLRFVLLITGFWLSWHNHWSASIAIGVFSITTSVMYVILFFLNQYSINEVIRGKTNLPRSLG